MVEFRRKTLSEGQMVNEQNVRQEPTPPGESTAQPRAARSRTGIDRFFAPNYEVNHSARLFQSHYANVWDSERDQERHPRWMDSMGGRFGIRLMSRGLLGAAFLTGGNWMLTKYVPASSLMRKVDGNLITDWESLKAHDLTKYRISRVLNIPAQIYDYTFGKPIGAIFGEDAVRFRTSRNFNPMRADARRGRTYGEEAVNVTLDFALGSVGDAWGRRLAGILDPNVKKDWIDKDGHVEWKKLGKATLKATWDIFSYNQMEDWFAAIPYVYQMRMQRRLLDKQWPGSRLALDHSLNGGGFRVNKEGEIIGDYTLPGALDLQLRFMGYNVYTLMFRDGYQHIKSWFEHRRDPEKPQHDRPFFEELVKYIGKTAIKANTYMAPSVPFFWAMRTGGSRLEAPRIYVPEGYKATPNSVHECSVINLQRFENGQPVGDVKRYDSSHRHANRSSYKVFYTDKSGTTHHQKSIDRNIADREYLNRDFNPFNKIYDFNLLSSALNPLGRVSAFLGTKLGNAASKIRFGGITPETIRDSARQTLNDNRKFWDAYNNTHSWSQKFVNNSLSYTPYMIAKYEFANQWDTPQMDAALYRAIDGLDHGDAKEVKEGLKDYWHVLLRKPVSAETERRTWEPRGLINSQRQGQDSENRRDGRLPTTKTFADLQREHKIASKKAEKDGSAPIRVDAATAQAAQQAWTDQATPSSDIRPRGDNGWQAYEISRMQQRDGRVPPGATIH